MGADTRFPSLLVLAMFLAIISPFVDSGGELPEARMLNNSSYSEKSGELPAGWTHRPVVEVFTSLSCPPCMANSEPQVIAMQQMLDEDPSAPFTVITFHQTNGGDGDDPTSNQEAKDRYNHYSPVGTPDGEIDGGYIQSQELYSSIEEAAQRDVRPTSLHVFQAFSGDGTFTITANLTYLGDDWSPDPTDPTGSLNDLVDGDVLNFELHLFIIEHDVFAYSSEEGHKVVTPMVFRGNAGSPSTGSIQADESITIKVDWTIPTEIEHPSSHATPGVHTMDPMVIPGNIEVVAVVYDTDDESKSSSPNPKQGLPRAINSATPKSTAYDMENTLPDVVDIKEVSDSGDANIKVFFEDEDGIGTAHIFYNFVSANHTESEWMSQEMTVSGTEICDEEGVCYAYGDAVGDAAIEVQEGLPLFYQVAFVDGQNNYNQSDVVAFAGGEPIVPIDEGGISLLVWSAMIFIALLSISGFTIWARQPYAGSYFGTL